jgi:hypothetical protein
VEYGVKLLAEITNPNIMIDLMQIIKVIFAEWYAILSFSIT